jgi:nitroreductase
MPSHLHTSAHDLIHTRQTILPKRLLSPGPDAEQLHALLSAAAAAPDHGQLQPWRFVGVPSAQRAALANVFAQALHERDALATPEQMAQARDKAFRAPLLMLLVVDGECGDPDIDLHERLISAGCAVQNLLLMATAQGFGSALTSGKALKSTPLRTLFGLQPHEHAPCFVSVGTVQSRKPGRLRPQPADIWQTLGDERTDHPLSTTDGASP